MGSSTLLRVLAATLALASVQADRPDQAWKAGKFKTLVTFGDSYTDENRLGYFIQNGGSAPPVGWEQPVVCVFYPQKLNCVLTTARACRLLQVAYPGHATPAFTPQQSFTTMQSQVPCAPTR
jgi:hypothetical protein